jgi:HK97 gp10 family phage protein
MLKSRFPAIAAELDVLAREGLKAGIGIVAERAQERVPVETGELRDAIHTASEPEGEYVVAGDSHAFYGHLVEHGTTYTPPRPFLVPALEESRKEVLTLVKAALRRAE